MESIPYEKKPVGGQGKEVGGREAVEKKEVVKYTPSESVIRDFLNLDETTLSLLQTRLTTAEGHGRIWVHPLYAEQLPGSFWGGEGRDLAHAQKHLRTAFLRTAQSVLKNPDSSPLFVYEVLGEIKNTKGVLARELGIDSAQLEKSGIVFVPTEKGGPAPNRETLKDSMSRGDEFDRAMSRKITRMEKAASAWAEHMQNKHLEIARHFPDTVDMVKMLPWDEEKWDQYLKMIEQQRSEGKPVEDEYDESRSISKKIERDFNIDVYNTLGLRSALVSGAYIESKIDDKTGEISLSGCAGLVTEILREAGISTDISRNVWPPKEEMRVMGAELKQTGT